jgi:hypothetical protein
MRRLLRQEHSTPREASVTHSNEAQRTLDWEFVQERLADRWPVLTADELEATRGRGELLAALLQAKLEYAQRLAEESVGHPLERIHPPEPAETRTWVGLVGASAVAALGLSVGAVLFL